MKKILSYVLLVAMLVGCMIPAFTANALGDAKLAIENSSLVQGEASFENTVTIADNSGIAELEVAVVYKSTDISGVTIDFEGTVFDAASSSVGSALDGTKPKVKNTIIGLGLTPADYKAVIVSLYTEDGSNATSDGKLFSVNFAVNGDPAENAQLSYGVGVVTSTDENGDEVAFDAIGATANATVQKDPYLGIYQDLSLFVGGPSEIELGTDKVTVQIRIDGNNRGLWTFRSMVAYDPAWVIDYTNTSGIGMGSGTGISNGNMFPDAAMNINIIEASRYPASEAFEYFGKTADVAGMNSIIAVSIPDVATEAANCYKQGGTFFTVTFNVPADAQVGDTLVLKLAHCRGDQAVADDSNPGNPMVVVEPVDVYDYVCTIVEKPCEHLSTHENIIPATCTVPGETQTVCDDCGEVVSSTPIPAPGHQWVAGTIVPPTCKDDGYTVYTCTVCQETENRDPVPSTGLHDYEEGTPVPATCAADGYTPWTCKHCGTVDKRDIVLKETVSHTPGTPVVVPPTCTVDGSSTVYCTVCDTVISTDVIDATDHTWVAGDTHAPTCTERGWTDYECSVCQETKKDNYTNAHGHDWATATCTAPKTCSRCGATEGNALGHLSAAPVIVTPPTCTEPGYTTVKCQRCGELLSEDHPAALGHMEHVDIDTLATYDADGHYKVTCMRCQQVLADTVRPRLTVKASVVCLIKVDGVNKVINTIETDGLYKGDVFEHDIPAIPGYTAVEGTVKLEIELEETGNVIVYFYTANTDISYTVKYVDENGKELADAKVVTGQTMASEVTEKAIEIKGYTVDKAEKTLVLAAENNEIVFTYKADKVENNPAQPENRPTGDNMVFIIIALAVAAVGAGAVVIIRSRRKEH